ncbi:glycosyl transferase family 2 [Sulfolobus islandicus Y.N.15.51]|uniref:Glycosyl transferase family 2 n=1 Tax=Saccharolobus islandicus (strain Y.N.15.51 / Yellowstone \|nr:glycosyltransferase [Sulfolobus islandicus]ACP47574.1 glycosyl transferase family 2 [Sulfolobus islandicus Y.N.15.51]
MSINEKLVKIFYIDGLIVYTRTYMRLDITFYLLVSTLISILTILYISFTLPLAFTYRPKSSQASIKRSEITVLIPVYKEDVDVFKEVIDSVKKQDLKFIVVGDGCDEPYKSIVRTKGGLFIKLDKNMGKRRAIREGFKYVKTPYVLLLDSDTILPDDSVDLLSSKLIGDIVAVSPEISVLPGKNIIAYHVSEMMQRLREISYRALGRFGSIVSLNGQCILVRTDVIRPLIESEEFNSVKLWRFSTILGDDRQITNYIYSNGYKATVTKDVVVKTKAPDTISGLLKQMVRWYRSNNFFLIKEIGDGTIFKKGFFYMFTVLYWYALPLLTLLSYSLYTEIILSHVAKHWDFIVRAIITNPTKFIENVIVYRIDNLFDIDPTPIFHKFSHFFPHHFNPSGIMLIYGNKLSTEMVLFHYFYVFHTFVGEVSTIVSIVMIVSILLYTRRIRGFALGLLAFPLMFFADIFALMTIWRQKKWSGRS